MAGGGPFVIIAHSQGSMIAYDVLRRLQKEQIEVPLFLTIGSPLGIAEVQDVIRQWTGGGLPFPPCVERWVNIADRLDPVAIDSTLANDFGADIEDRQVVNLDSPRHPHSGTGYLQTKLLRDVVGETVGTGFQQAIAPFAIAKDLVADLEDGLRDKRHEVLIQLSDGPGTPPADRLTHAKAVEQVSERIKDIVTASGAKPDDARIEPLRHFVAAELTRLEVEALRSHYADLQMKGVWRNAVKRTLIHQSTPYGAGAAGQHRLRVGRQGDRMGHPGYRHTRRPSAFRRIPERDRTVGLHPDRRAQPPDARHARVRCARW